MRAVNCRSFGPVAALQIEDVPPPEVASGTVAIDVAAAGVNFPDGLIVQGKYQAQPSFPFVPGSEAAGIVRAIGAGVEGFRPGDRVATFCGIGGYAQQVVAPAAQVYALPETLDFATASGFLIAYGTSYHALKDRARLKAGETLLVLGAAGGVGLTAVELGKIMGARVIAAASSAEKLALAKDYGADALIDYGTEDLRARVKALTDGRGVDVVYDPIGGPRSEVALRGLAWGGRQLVIGFAAGEIAKLPANLLLLKSADLLGVFWGASVKADPLHHAANIAALFALQSAGKLRPHIAETYPLQQAVYALNRVMERQARGKVILAIDR